MDMELEAPLPSDIPRRRTRRPEVAEPGEMEMFRSVAASLGDG